MSERYPATAIIRDLAVSEAAGSGGEEVRIAEQTADGLYIVDPNGNFTFVNPAAVELFGYDDESDLLGRNSHATTHYQRRDGSPYPVDECPLLRPRTTGESVRVDDDWFVRRDGSMIPVAYSSAPFPMEAGTGAVVAIRDMSELRRAEDELRVLQTATMLISSAETFEDAVANVIREVCLHSGWVAGEMWLLDSAGVRLQLAPGWWAATPALEAFFVEASAPQTMGLGEGLPGTVWRERRPVWIDVVTTRREGPRIDTARRVGFAAGVGIPVLADGEVVAVLGFFADHRRTEDDRWTDVLSAIAAQLGPVFLRKRAEDELTRKAIELARSNADLQLFAELTAHELQQPLHAVIHMIATAVEGASDLEAVLQLALSTARRMQESIEGLLRYASVDEPQTSAVAADDVLDRALADLASELEAVGAEIVREPLPTVEADAAQLRGVFHNLVMNAVRYRSADPLRVEIGFVDGAVYVRDNGKGIDPAEQQRVFELFRRATSAGEAGGTGIGLALARRVIEAHGGRLWLESEPGRGTVFFFRLHVTA